MEYEVPKKSMHKWLLNYFWKEKGKETSAKQWLEDPIFYRIIKYGLYEEQREIEKTKEAGDEDYERFFKWQRLKKYFDVIVEEAIKIDPEKAKNLGKPRKELIEDIFEKFQLTEENAQRISNEFKELKAKQKKQNNQNKQQNQQEIDEKQEISE